MLKKLQDLASMRVYVNNILVYNMSDLTITVLLYLTSKNHFQLSVSKIEKKK